MTDSELDTHQYHSREVAQALRKACLEMDLTPYAVQDFMAGVMFFAVETLSWCHHEMASEPGTLELVIAQLGDALRVTVANLEKKR